MFTGLVEGRGIVFNIRSEGAAIRLDIDAPDQLLGNDDQNDGRKLDGECEPDGECWIGESVAVNGCCVTVVEVRGRRWSFQAGTETLSKTNLGKLAAGDAVNLERSLPAGGRLGGHFVQGHVDGLGEVVSIETDGEWVTMWFGVADPLADQMVSKGSVAVDGISLTVVDVTRNRFSVALIPHTLEVTTLGTRQVGDLVNIETDILGKYVQKFLRTTGTD